VGVVDTPSARETFTPCELTAAYKVFKERGPHYLDAETGLSASAHRFGERVLLVYEESETGWVVLIHRSAWNRISANFALTEFSGSSQVRADQPPASSSSA
jgi:hypothetical protein